MSIIAVVLLILGSLTNVVGYQSVKSSSMSESPLFSLRTQRATNQQQNSITFHYLGEGKGTLLQFPTRDNKTDLLKRAIEYFNKMDDTTFKKFIDLLFYHLQKKEKTTDIKIRQIVLGLRQLRDGSENFGIYDTGNIRDITWSNTPTLCWFPGCILFRIFAFFIFLCLFWIFKTVRTGETLCVGTCISHCTEIIDMKEFRYLLNKM